MGSRKGVFCHLRNPEYWSTEDPFLSIHMHINRDVGVPFRWWGGKQSGLLPISPCAKAGEHALMQVRRKGLQQTIKPNQTASAKRPTVPGTCICCGVCVPRFCRNKLRCVAQDCCDPVDQIRSGQWQCALYEDRVENGRCGPVVVKIPLSVSTPWFRAIEAIEVSSE